jgi:hypothetical protein
MNAPEMGVGWMEDEHDAARINEQSPSEGQ